MSRSCSEWCSRSEGFCPAAGARPRENTVYDWSHCILVAGKFVKTWHKSWMFTPFLPNETVPWNFLKMHNTAVFALSTCRWMQNVISAVCVRIYMGLAFRWHQSAVGSYWSKRSASVGSSTLRIPSFIPWFFSASIHACVFQNQRKLVWNCMPMSTEVASSFFTPQSRSSQTYLAPKIFSQHGLTEGEVFCFKSLIRWNTFQRNFELGDVSQNQLGTAAFSWTRSSGSSLGQGLMSQILHASNIEQLVEKMPANSFLCWPSVFCCFCHSLFFFVTI